MISAHNCYKIYHLTLTTPLQCLTKQQCTKYRHFLCISTVKYGVFEQVRHTEKVIYSHCERVHMVYSK